MINVRDLLSALLIGAVGLFFLIGSLRYPIGTHQQMGPGYFPLVLSSITIAAAIWIFISGLKIRPELSKIEWRSLLAISGSVAAFALGASYLGLIPAIFLSVLVAIFGDDAPTLRRLLILPAVLAIAAWLLFRVGLGLPIVAFRGF